MNLIQDHVLGVWFVNFVQFLFCCTRPLQSFVLPQKRKLDWWYFLFLLEMMARFHFRLVLSPLPLLQHLFL